MALKEMTLRTSHGEIAVRESNGNGTPVLLIHGNSSSSAVFRNQLEGEIGNTYRLIAPDLPGHGKSSDAIDPERSYCMEGYADAITEVMTLLGVGNAGALGWSLGGHIGLEMISRYPGLLGLMITGTPPVAPEEIFKGFRPSKDMGLAAKETLTNEEALRFTRSTCGQPFEPYLLEAVRRADGRTRSIMFEKFRAGSGDNQKEIVAQAHLPIAVVNGRDEPFVDLDFVSTVAFANLWEGKTHVIANSGHAPFWDSATEFDRYLDRFIRDISRG